MIRHVLIRSALLFSLLTPAFATTAFAAAPPDAAARKSPAPKDGKSQFYIFDASAFDGIKRAPAGTSFTTVKRSTFGRMSLVPMKSFLPALEQTAAQRTFK